VYGREELDKYGDTNVGDVLKRLPGVSMQGNAPRMRGLGAGYTLILINGDPAPPGFQFDQLNPAQVERIEVSRGGTADRSAQAVAGTINIILKDAPRVAQRDLRLGAGFNAVRPTGSATFTLGERSGGVGYSLPVSVFQWRNINEGELERRTMGSDGQTTWAKGSTPRQGSTGRSATTNLPRPKASCKAATGSTTTATATRCLSVSRCWTPTAALKARGKTCVATCSGTSATATTAASS
jgi:outer membrane receptor for ferrienterochelin and colicins